MSTEPEAQPQQNQGPPYKISKYCSSSMQPFSKLTQTNLTNTSSKLTISQPNCLTSASPTAWLAANPTATSLQQAPQQVPQQVLQQMQQPIQQPIQQQQIAILTPPI